MKNIKKLKIYGLLTMALFWATFFSVLSGVLPTFVPLVFISLLIISSFFMIIEIEKLVNRHMESKALPSLDFLDDNENDLKEESLKIQKGGFVLQKHILSSLEALEQKTVSKEDLENSFFSLSEAVIQSAKTSIKYDRNNAKQVINAIEKTGKATKKEDVFSDERLVGLLTQLVEEVQTEKILLGEISKKLEALASGSVALTSPLPVQDGDVTANPEPPAVESKVFETSKPVVETEPTVEAEPEPISAPEPSPAPQEEPFDPNKPMSPEDIAALIAATNAASEPEPTVEAEPEPISAPEPSPAPQEEPFDPNKPMSPEDIAALIAATNAASEPEPTVEAKPEPISAPEPSPAPQEEPFDPNKPMSPEDIAALIAATNAANETEPTVEAKPEPVSAPEPSPAPQEEPFDPNKPMSPEDIAALIASLGE